MSWLGQGRGKKGHGFQSGASAGWGVAGCNHVMSHHALVRIFARKSPSLCTLLLIVLLLLLFVFLSRCCFQWISVKTIIFTFCVSSPTSELQDGQKAFSCQSGEPLVTRKNVHQSLTRHDHSWHHPTPTAPSTTLAPNRNHALSSLSPPPTMM